jgi:hypothetical protein
MAKIQIKSEKLTPFGGIFSIMEKFDSMLSPVIIDADKSVKRLSAYTTRQRELAEIEDPDERNPKHAGRPKKPYTEKAQSKAIRVIGSIADQVKTINDFIREHPYEEDRVKFLLSSVIEQLK